MLQSVLIFLAVIYIKVATCLLIRWFKRFQQDIDTNSQIRHSVILLAIATIFWPIVVPFTYLELLSKYQKIKEAIEYTPVDRATQDFYRN